MASARPSFEEVYRKHFGYVLHVLRRLGVPFGEREDVCQEVFLAVHRSLPTFDPARHILPWLHGIAFHVAKNHLALARNHREVFMDDDHELVEPGHDPEHHTAAEQARDLLIKLMQTIELDRRVVLSMHDLDGISMVDIAGELGISMSAGYKRLETARRELQAAAARFAARERRAVGQAAIFAVPFNLTAFLDADRYLPDVSDNLRARVWSRLQGAIALGGPGAPGGAGAAMPAPPSAVRRLLAKVSPHVAPFVLGAIAGAAGLYALLPRAEKPPAPPAIVAPAPVSPAVTAEAPSVTAPLPLPTSTGAAAPSTPTSALQGPRATIEEDTLIMRARMAYAHGDTQSALDALNQHARQHPGGRLAADREALRAQVLERQRAAASASSAPAPSAPGGAASATVAPHRVFGTEE